MRQNKKNTIALTALAGVFAITIFLGSCSNDSADYGTTTLPEANGRNGTANWGGSDYADNDSTIPYNNGSDRNRASGSGSTGNTRTGTTYRTTDYNGNSSNPNGRQTSDSTYGSDSVYFGESRYDNGNTNNFGINSRYDAGGTGNPNYLS